jgi:hypothetical protein
MPDACYEPVCLATRVRKDHGQFVDVCFSPAPSRIQVGFFLQGIMQRSASGGAVNAT